jgi:hypothetical protein
MTECAHGVRNEAVKGISSKDAENLQRLLRKMRENLNGQFGTENSV